jgi:hypothetical protein
MFFYGEPLPKQREKWDLTQKNGDLPSFHWAVVRIWDLNRSESKLSLHTGKLGMGHATNDFPREWGGWTSNYSKNSTWQTKSQKFYSYPYSHVVDACWNAQELILWFHIWPKRTWGALRHRHALQLWQDSQALREGIYLCLTGAKLTAVTFDSARSNNRDKFNCTKDFKLLQTIS